MKFLILAFIFFALPVCSQEILLTENFENGIPDDWQLKSSNERRNWFAKTFNDVPYVQMSAFGGKGKPGYKVVAELHSPLMVIDEKTCKLRFSFADAYQNGQPLKVFITNENMQPVKSLNSIYWAEMVNNSGKYDNVYEATDWIQLPKLNQPYRIGFIYDSNDAENIITTIIQLKEVDVWCE